MKLIQLRTGDRRPSIGIIGQMLFHEERQLRKIGASRSDKDSKLNQPFSEMAHYWVPMPMARRLFNKSNDPKNWQQPTFMKDWRKAVGKQTNGLLVNKDVVEYYKKWLAAEKEMAGVKRNQVEVIDSILSRHQLGSDFFAREPKPHQKAGLAFFLLSYELGAGHIMLFDEMRTGKTKQAIDIARFLLFNKLISNVLIIVPPSVRRVWYNELRQKDAPFYSSLSAVVHGTKAKRRELWEQGFYFYIVNYESLRNDKVEIYEWQKNRPGKWLMIVDEAHKLKNVTSLQSKVILSHGKIFEKTEPEKYYEGLQPDYSVFLTGTPVANAPIDAWSCCDFACPGILNQNLTWFKNEFSISAGRGGGAVTGYKKLDEVRWRLARISMRRVRADIMFDESVTMERYGVMDEEQKKAYESMREDLYAEVIGEDGELTTVQARGHLAKIVRLQQITSGYLSPNPDEVTWFPGFGWKVKELDTLVEEYLENLGKIVIWSRFVPPLMLLQERYAKHDALIIRGQMGEKATENMYKFQQDPKYKIMLAQIQTSEGRGFQPATTAVFLDKWWSPHLNKQAADRIVGIENPVTVCIVPLITEGSIDMRIEFLLKEKKDWSDAVTGDVRENEIVIPQVDKNTLLYLLSKPEDARIFEEAYKNE